ncbi:putative disease resistance protein RGA1 [Triticum aestivum]|uniref:putative disease resistance protein RGA1 n=1 Tax=Triticum aestivum TaxID=4565 RepID=UPI001D023E89|nr:putative disease resistance protein RGA1 [Triticum aestivum]
MPVPAALVFAGKFVATPAISFLVNKAFTYVGKYFESPHMDEVKNRLVLAMPKIQAVFDAVNPEYVKEQSSALDAWLWQLRDAVEAAEDAIDELEYYELKEKANDQKIAERGSPFDKMKHKFVKSVKSVKTLKKVADGDIVRRLMKLVDALDKAVGGVDSFLSLTDHLNGAFSSSQQQVQADNDRQTGSTLSATIFVGREKEKEKIIGWLANTSSQTNILSILSVVGHGGMGKTSLAQTICEQQEVLDHFKLIWVTVSTSFDATSLTRKILECTTGAKPKADQLEPLQRDLKEKLKSDKFLLVLDDVWEDKKRDEWEKLFAPLKKLNNAGSKILLTTRMQSVADMAARVMGVETDQCLTLQGLEEDETFELFTHHAFSGLKNPADYGNLTLIGEQIAKKLLGCPLLTKVVGEHLQGKATVEYWSRFLHKGLEHFKGTEEDIMRVLRLSYYHLPTELQICFRYCCIIPRDDYGFLKKKLVQLWIGSGLISQALSDTHTLEETAEEYLAQLTRKSFSNMKSRDGQLEEEWYVMHDLMHELARNVSTVCALEMVVESSKSLRLYDSQEFCFADKFKFGNLKHLRYIYVPRISPGMIRGGGLETETYESRYLGYLERLRYVSFGVSGFGNFCISKLTSLQELHDYRVGGTKCNEISAVGNLRDLGELGLEDLENFQSYEEAKNAKLKEKQRLNKLSLKWPRAGQMTDDLNLDNLEPNVNISVLEINGYAGPKIPFLIENCSLKNMVTLQFKGCMNWEYLPSLGELVMLNELMLYDLPKLGQISRSSDMSSSSSSTELLLPQSLKSLDVIECQKLRELPILPPSLESLLIKDVGLTKLASIGKISSESIEPRSSKLDFITVTKCPCLTSLEGSLLEQKLYMRTLSVLRLVDCVHLESASIPFEEMRELKELKIMECPKLRMIRDAKDMHLPLSLRNLAISCDYLEPPLLGSLQLLTNLCALNLHNCSSLVSPPSGDVFKSADLCAHRGMLKIRRCSTLAKAGSSSLNRVASGSGGVEPGSSLQIRTIQIDLPLLLEPLKSLCHTEKLDIMNGSEMESLPEQWLLQNLQSLCCLYISGACDLKSFPPRMKDLCFLENFALLGAGQLQSLPSLPSSLKCFDLIECHPELEKKITKHGSPERKKNCPHP